MYQLFKKEISGYFTSLTAYIVILVFLLITSLFIWIFPGHLNILNAGYASLDSLFTLAPWVFLFLIPAVSMRLFSEEKKTGTLELLITRPLTELQISLAKYFAGLSLVLFSLLPSLLFFLSVFLLGNPVGNIDTGGTWGSYIALFFLAAIYTAIGLFASALSDNQIVAFILALVLSFFFFMGFEQIADILFSGKIAIIISNLGINKHYQSMSRGVLDLRDLSYFIGVILVFIYAAKLMLESRKW